MYIIEKEKTYKFYMFDLKTSDKVYFEDLERLLIFLTKKQSIHCFNFGWTQNLYDNIYLDNLNLTGYDRQVKSKFNIITKDVEYYSELKRYMFYDSEDKIVDVSIYAKAIKKRAIEYYNEHKWDHKPSYIFRRGPVPGTNSHYRGHYCRSLKTIREKRYSCDNEHKPYIRGKRNFANIPDTNDDHYVKIRRDWKSKTKQRKQWARHMEYSKVPDKYAFNDFFDIEDDIDFLDIEDDI